MLEIWLIQDIENALPVKEEVMYMWDTIDFALFMMFVTIISVYGKKKSRLEARVQELEREVDELKGKSHGR